MYSYDFQTATADRIAEIFRNATIDADGKEIKSGGQRRVLLADEVGLGKTRSILHLYLFKALFQESFPAQTWNRSDISDA